MKLEEKQPIKKVLRNIGGLLKDIYHVWPTNVVSVVKTSFNQEIRIKGEQQ